MKKSMDLKILESQIDGCAYFKWREALWLNSFGICAFPNSEKIVSNIIKTAQKMDELREFFGAPLFISSWYRPAKYNDMIGGAKKSQHVLGLAVDFTVKGLISENARLMLKPNLEKFNIRCEALNTVHVHIDLNCVQDMPNDSRFFMP